MVNDSVEENHLEEENNEEIRPLENISREAFNSHVVRFYYYSWSPRQNLNDETISISVDSLEENNQENNNIPASNNNNSQNDGT